MHATIDYITFTLVLPKWNLQGKRIFQRHVMAQVYKALGQYTYTVLFPDEAQEGPSFAPYVHGWQSGSTKSVVMAHPDLQHALVQLSGQACIALDSEQVLYSLIRSVAARCTRIDVAGDILTDVSPSEFVEAGFSDRFSYASHTTSPRGESVYIGSPASARRAIVYRYNPPHPRARYLRVEHRARGDHASYTCKAISIDGLPGVLAGLGQVFGWKHDLWDMEGVQAVPVPSGGVRKDGLTAAHWLLTQVFPAMRRYEREGRIDDLRAFMEEHLFDESYAASNGVDGSDRW